MKEATTESASSFPDPNKYVQDWPIPSNERRMFQLRYVLINKPDWQRKICDPDIRAAWKREALAQIIPLPDIVPVRERDQHILFLTEAQAEAVLNEVEWLARKYPAGSPFQVRDLLCS